jgi:hypothetical protein
MQGARPLLIGDHPNVLQGQAKLKIPRLLLQGLSILHIGEAADHHASVGLKRPRTKDQTQEKALDWDNKP